MGISSRVELSDSHNATGVLKMAATMRRLESVAGFLMWLLQGDVHQDSG